MFGCLGICIEERKDWAYWIGVQVALSELN